MTVIKKITNTSLQEKNKTIQKKSIEKKPFKSVKSNSQSSLCDEVKGCDIEKIAELLIKKGQEKKFPDISSR